MVWVCFNWFCNCNINFKSNRREIKMNKIEITRPIIGICYMQVCAEKDATDEEILAVCNRENPSGTTYGWSRVIRQDTMRNDEGNKLPIQCKDNPNRIHFLVCC
jgi:hypothetical protein